MNPVSSVTIFDTTCKGLATFVNEKNFALLSDTIDDMHLEPSKNTDRALFPCINHFDEHADSANAFHLNDLLTIHPEWQIPVDKWPQMSSSDKTWLLELHECHQLGIISVSMINHFYAHVKEASKHMPCENTPNLLKFKVEIGKILEEVTSIDLQDKQLTNCPNFSLFPNLKVLLLSKQTHNRTLYWKKS